MKNITIIGAGAFGFAIAKHLSDKLEDKEDFHREDISDESLIKIYDVDTEVIEHMKTQRSQKNLFPEIKLNHLVEPTTDVKDAVKDADILIISIPTQFIRKFLDSAKEHIKKDITIVNCSKGLELSTHKFISDIIEEELKETHIDYIFANLSGGMIAKEFISGQGIFGAEVSCEDKDTGKFLQKLFSSKRLRIYLNNDIKGVEASGALKNVISIASGAVDGLGYPYGSKTLIVSLGAREIRNLGLRLGGKTHTFNLHAQAFGNDFVMSTTGNTRNRYLGELLGKGISPEEAMEIMKREKKTAEGYYTTKVAYELARKFDLQTPIIDMVYKALYEGKYFRELITGLMASELEMTEE